MERVRLKNDPARSGYLSGKSREGRGGRLYVQIHFPDGDQWMPEDQIEKVTGSRQGPLEQLQSGRLGRPDDLRRALTHIRLTGRLADVIYSMEVTNTDFYAYQFKPVLKMMYAPNGGILIADEVGLGKTIEAGLIWTELRARFDLRRLLVLCPAALREKWRDELADKFGVMAQICDAKGLLDVLENPQRYGHGFAIICSQQGLRPRRNWSDPDNKSPSALLARHLERMQEEDRSVDLLIIDEAHHLRNPETQTHAVGRLLRGVSEYAALLTATPIHNRNVDLFSLLNLLDGDTFTRKEDLAEIIAANAPLVKAREMVLSAKINAEQFGQLLSDAEGHRLLAGNRQLASLRAQDANDRALADAAHRSRIAHKLETVNLLGHSLTRMRKRDVTEWRVVREPIPEFVEMDALEAEFYDMVTNVVTAYAATRLASERFLLVTPQRQMASCMPAALARWKAAEVELSEADITDTEDDEASRNQIGPLTTILAQECSTFADVHELRAVDSKYARLVEILRALFRKDPGTKVVLFSTFRGTLSYLEGRLGEDGITSTLLQGGQRRSKQEVIEEFKEGPGSSVLLSSEVGSEGVDLQFCWVLVNYDLPWNPMRVEQRIGRIDRLGQISDKVLIWNLFYAETIDARIYQRLYEKLDLCQHALGDFDAILGDEIHKLEIDLLSGNLTADQQSQRIDQTAQALENLRNEEERLEAEATHLIAYGDYILNQVKAAQDLNRWISGDDIRAYVTDFLGSQYGSFDLLQIDTDETLFEVNLSTDAKYDLAEFIKNKRLAPTRLTQNQSRPVRCRFQNRVQAGGREPIETISQMHSLVRFVSHKISEVAEQLRPAIACTLERAKNSDLPDKGIYLMVAALWSVEGLQAIERLVFAGVNLSTDTKILTDEQAERLLVQATVEGENWREHRAVIDAEALYDLAFDDLFGGLQERFDQYVEEIRSQNEDRVDIRSRTLERHLIHQQKMLDGVKQTHLENKRDALVRATEGRIKALHSRVHQQKEIIEMGRSIKYRNDQVCIALVNLS